MNRQFERIIEGLELAMRNADVSATAFQWASAEYYIHEAQARVKQAQDLWDCSLVIGTPLNFYTVRNALRAIPNYLKSAQARVNRSDANGFHNAIVVALHAFTVMKEALESVDTYPFMGVSA